MRKFLSGILSLLLLMGLLPAAYAEEPALGVTYEIFVASFQDSGGDGIGDLQGIIDRLDYLQSLGVRQIWLMPIHPSPSYHKYDVLDYYAVDPSYGTLDDFDRLTAACKERGIRVILDLVLNHSSSSHPWFLAACDDKFFSRTGKTTDWYVFYPEEGNARHKISGCSWWYEGQFGSHMPDFNLDSESLRAEFAKIITFWQSHGVGGFRLDAVTSYYTGANASTADFLRFVCETAKANDPDCYLVGEAWTDEATILTLYESGIDSLFNFPASDSTGRFVKAALAGKSSTVASAQADWNARIRAVSPASVDAPFVSNHDMARARGMLRSKVPNEKSRRAAVSAHAGCPNRLLWRRTWHVRLRERRKQTPADGVVKRRSHAVQSARRCRPSPALDRRRGGAGQRPGQPAELVSPADCPAQSRARADPRRNDRAGRRQ